MCSLVNLWSCGRRRKAERRSLYDSVNYGGAKFNQGNGWDQATYYYFLCYSYCYHHHHHHQDQSSSAVLCGCLSLACNQMSLTSAVLWMSLLVCAMNFFFWKVCLLRRLRFPTVAFRCVLRQITFTIFDLLPTTCLRSANQQYV